MKGIAIFPGAFKPPTKGHFKAVKELATNTFSGATFKKDSTGKIKPGSLAPTSVEDIVTDVLVIISNKSRNGITADTSYKIWNIYKKYLPENVSIIKSNDTDPVRTALNLVKNNPNNNYFGAVFLRSEEDLPDLSRISTFEKYDNAKGLILRSSLTDIRATDLRKTVVDQDFGSFKKFIPEEIPEKEIETIFEMIKNAIENSPEQKINKEIGEILDKFIVDGDISEGSSGSPIAARSAIPSKDRARLINLYNQLRETLYLPAYDIEFQQDRIVITLKDQARISYDYTPYMASLVEYMLDKKMKITPLPEVKIKSDIKESADFFGRTAFYDPYRKEITLYVMGRHPKDVMRSFSHEMIHHMQNMEGKITDISTTNTNEDGNLSQLEEEAYLLGNMTFRNWEDKIKKEL